ncbi:MAG: hypothetical protein AB7K86_08380 [Rhodospirillales bacterium]
MIAGLVTAWGPQIVIAAAAGGFLVGGGLAGYGVHWWMADSVADARRDRDELMRQVQRASDRAEDRSAAAQREVDRVVAAAARSEATLREDHDETIREIRRTASSDRVCLSAPVVRLLQRTSDRRAGPRPDPGPAADPGPGPAAAADGPAASEQAIAGWIESVRREYVLVRDRHRTLADAVRPLPCVEWTE